MSTPTDSAEKVVAELRKRANQIGQLLCDPPRPHPDAALMERAADHIERVERERDAVYAAMGNSVRFMDPPDGGDPTQAEMVANMRRQLDAAEARVTALDAEKAGLVKVLQDIAFMRPVGPTRNKLAAAMERKAIDALGGAGLAARQALSRSTEVNDD